MVTIRSVILCLGILTSIWFVESYRILGIFPLNAKSHNVMFNALMKGLAKRGHQVDHITHYPVKNPPPNYKVVINLDGTLKGIVNKFTFETVKSFSMGSIAKLAGTDYGNDLCKLLALDNMQRFIKNLPNNPPYDVYITAALHHRVILTQMPSLTSHFQALGANCFMGVSHLLKVPLIALASTVEYPWITHFIGNYDNLAVIPHVLLTNFERNNFWDRLYNFLTYYWNVYVFNLVTEDAQTEYMRKYISPDTPNIREVERNIALTIVNRHPVIYGAKAVTSSLIEASGLHIEENDDVLDESLKKWLDDSKHGVVYFTFGSLVLIESFPTSTIKEMYKVFTKLAPMRVLMKVFDTSKLPPGLPNNVLTRQWMPQQPILAHKNIRAYLTHGGMMGCQEALHFGVPLIGVPLFADQGQNIAAFAAKNMAVKLDMDNITEVSLTEAFNKVLNDPQYRKNAKYYSKTFKERPISAMDTSEFWIKYIIRNGPEVLRSPGLEMPWWQTALIDVLGFIFLSIFISLSFVYCITKKLYKNICMLFSTSTDKGKSKIQ